MANFRISPVNIDNYNNCVNILVMGKLLAIITLILPLLLSSGSWAIEYDDLLERDDGLVYTSFTDVTFTGEIKN